MHLGRTRFKRDIVAEYLPPRRRKKREDVVVFADGMPTMPGNKKVAEHFSQNGYFTFFPRYRGTWESGGHFLKQSPDEDILDVIEVIAKGDKGRFRDAASGEWTHVSPRNIYVIGVSFGGPAALFCSRDNRVTKVVAISSVIDWQKPGRAEPMDWLHNFVREGFGQGYRFKKADWNKLSRGNLYNPAASLQGSNTWARKNGNKPFFDGSKIFMIHAQDDEVCTYKAAHHFAKQCGARLKTYQRGGHFGASFLLKPAIFRQIMRFFHS